MVQICYSEQVLHDLSLHENIIKSLMQTLRYKISKVPKIELR